MCIPGVFDYMTKLVDESGLSTWHCRLCSYKSKQKHNVLKHVTRKHKKGEKLGCPGCNKFLRNKYDFNEHLARKHPTLSIERKELMSLDV